jgi:signal transduction histidine kinase
MRKQQYIVIYVASMLLMWQNCCSQTLLQKADLIPLSNDSLNKLATISYALDTKTADFIYDYLIERALTSNNTEDLYSAYHFKAYNYETQQLYADALHYDSLAAETIKNKDLNAYTSTLIDIAIVQRKLQHFPESRNLYLTVLELSKKNKDVQNQQNALCGLGILYDAAGNLDHAINYFKEALALAEANHDAANRIVYLNNLAEEFTKNKQYANALASIERAYNIAKTTDDYDSKIYIGQQYAQTLADLGRFDEALIKINETLAQCQGFSIRRDVNTLSIAKGEIFLKQHNTNAAATIFLECLARPMNVTHQATVNYELGKIYQDQGKIAKAKPYLLKSQTLAEQNQLLGYDEKSHRALYYIYSVEKNSKKALFHLEKANALRDEHFNFEKSAKVSELLFRYDLAQGEQKIKEVELTANRNLMWAGGLLSVLLILSLVYIMALRSGTYNALKKKSREIKAQKEQLEVSNQILFSKNQEIEAQKAQLEYSNQAMLLKNEEIEAQTRLLEESNGMLRQFSYAVAHDLKEPLRTMSSFIKIINRRYAPLLPSDSKEYFDFVISGADRMTKMLEGLLRYSMMSMNKNVEVEVFSLSDVVKEVTNSLYVTINERQAKIIFDDAMPMVCMNRLHTVQLVQNLVSNALKFVEQSPIIEIQSHVNELGQVLFSIKDNGIGIDKDSGGKLFQLFHRVHRDTTRFEGTGVGLALCKSIVEKYNGQIWFESEKDQGTEFFMSLPKAA